MCSGLQNHQVSSWLLDMTVEAIKDAIVQLSGGERQELADWFDHLQEDEWDRQMGGLCSGRSRNSSAGEYRTGNRCRQLRPSEAARATGQRLKVRSYALSFWKFYDALPEPIQEQSDKQHQQILVTHRCA
jgi:hypothetical protein